MTDQIVIPAGATSARRAVLDRLEHRLLAVRKTDGALFEFAVSITPNALRLAGENGLPSPETFGFDAVLSRGIAPVSVALGDDQNRGGSTTTRDTLVTAALIAVTVPDESHWGGRRDVDVIDAIDMAIQAALQTGGNVQEPGVWRRLDMTGGGAILYDEESGHDVFLRSFEIEYTNEVGRPWLGQGATPVLANRRPIASIHANTGPAGNVTSASVRITRAELILAVQLISPVLNPPDSDPITIELKAHTCGSLLDLVASSRWTVLNRDASLDAIPAADIFGIEDTVGALDVGSAVQLEVP